MAGHLLFHEDSLSREIDKGKEALEFGANLVTGLENSSSAILFQHCPVRKLHAVVSPPSPQPSPPEAGGEGVGNVAGFSNHKALNRFHSFPSPPMGERVRVRGK